MNKQTECCGECFGWSVITGRLCIDGNCPCHQEERRSKVEAGAVDFANRFEGVMKELAEEDTTKDKSTEESKCRCACHRPDLGGIFHATTDCDKAPKDKTAPIGSDWEEEFEKVETKFISDIEKCMSDNKRSQWVNVQAGSFLHTVPVTDIKPHGTKISDTEYELTAECACNPKVEARGLVIHNSFEDEQRISRWSKFVSNKE